MPSDRYTKKPVTVEAIQYTGANLREVLDFTGKHPRWGEWFKSFEDYEAHVCSDRGVFKILTLEGTMEALPGDWIIRGVKGEHYPCKPDIFAATYARADLCASGQQVRARIEALPSCWHTTTGMQGHIGSQGDWLYKPAVLAALTPAPQPEIGKPMTPGQMRAAIMDGSLSADQAAAWDAPQAEEQVRDLYLICKYGRYYRPNAQGYTNDVAEAGRYTLDEAVRHTHPNGPDGPRDGMTYIPAPTPTPATPTAQEAVPACAACEDNPKPPNIPCAVCGAHPPQPSETVADTDAIAKAIAFAGEIKERRGWDDLLPETRKLYRDKATAALRALKGGE